MIVLDASAFALVFTGDDPRADEADRVLRADPAWLVPEHWYVEVLAVIRGLLLGGKLDQAGADAAVSTLTSATVGVVPTASLLTRMWQVRANLSTYDAAYVAAAEAHDLTLVTADARIARAGVARCPVRALV
ncbi:MAG TPA: type II toxin-antitoxin system VapC family toxin [Cellulomonas sp.]